MLDIPRVFIHFCSTLVEVVVSTTTTIAHNMYDAATVALKSWWGYAGGNNETGLEVVERKPTEQQNLHDILEENDRLKRMWMLGCRPPPQPSASSFFFCCS